MSQDEKPNIMRGIAAYANPGYELEKRNYVKAFLGKCFPKDWPHHRDAMIERFGRETVRAVARSYYEASDYR